jgi:hypothetical protein
MPDNLFLIYLPSQSESPTSQLISYANSCAAYSCSVYTTKGLWFCVDSYAISTNADDCASISSPTTEIGHILDRRPGKLDSWCCIELIPGDAGTDASRFTPTLRDLVMRNVLQLPPAWHSTKRATIYPPRSPAKFSPWGQVSFLYPSALGVILWCFYCAKMLGFLCVCHFLCVIDILTSKINRKWLQPHTGFT